MREDQRSKVDSRAMDGVMVQRMNGGDVASENKVGCAGIRQVAMSTSESLSVSTSRTSDTFDTCLS